MSIVNQKIANELGVKLAQVTAAVALLDEGATVPFIARYRKEKTGGLDDTQLRNLEERLRYLRELETRQASILKTIKQQGKLTPALEKQILAAQTRTELEDLYLPFKKKRQTKGETAKKIGLEPLADTLLKNPNIDPTKEAAKYTSKEVADPAAALEGARHILMERFSESPALIGSLRKNLQKDGILSASVMRGKKEEGQKFADYFDFSEPIHKIPSHRALALFRARNEKIIRLNVDKDVADGQEHPFEHDIARAQGIQPKNRPADPWLKDTVKSSWKVKIHPKLTVDLFMELRQKAEEGAISVFASNLKDLLMAAPAGDHATLGLDPGLRTGVKVAVTDKMGKFVDHATIYPHVPRNDWDQSIAVLAALCAKHKVTLIAIGNGTGSRETDKLAGELMAKYPELKVQKIMVSEAGASVYSASELAAKEFPDLDVSIRGAVSIARRLQDPLAELVKIEPKAIGVGQYQHDVNQTALARSLDGVVEDSVNAVGVDVNTASAELLSHIAGLNKTIAQNIIDYRDKNGRFKTRRELLKVPRLGAKAYEQAAGFLRINGGVNPLDASAVHPEAYDLVKAIAKDHKRDVKSIIADTAFLKTINPKDYCNDNFGLPTVTDILAELEKPGRDPRPEFKTATFKEGVEKIGDLEEGMLLEGVVTNVADFGAFVDIGVHQDGLVHISQLADKYVSNPRDIVHTGDVVKVRVVSVEADRKRIALTMKTQENTGEIKANAPKARQSRGESKNYQNYQSANSNKSSKGNNDSTLTGLAAAFAKAKKG